MIAAMSKLYPRLQAICVCLLCFYHLQLGVCFSTVGIYYRSIYSVKVNHQRINLSRFLLSSSTSMNAVDLSTNVENNEILNISDLRSNSISQRISKGISILYKFSRPHTIKGTILASSMCVSRALIENPGRLSFLLLPRAFLGLIALLCGNAYIVGINQIYDVKIDEINKPYLPIAAKSLTSAGAWSIVIACLITGVTIVKSYFSPVIFGLYMIGILLGTIYSVPPIQLKRIPIFAGSIIAFVRGFLLNFGVYYAVREAMNIRFSWNPVVTFISMFMTIFASVIAITKDLSDVEGDVQYNINTFAARFGVKIIASMASIMLGLAYIAAIALPCILPTAFRKLPMMIGHGAFLSYLIYFTSQLDASDASSVKKYYKSIWNLFYLEYLLYPFI